MLRMDTMRSTEKPAGQPRPWVPPVLKEVGTVGDIVRAGGGKQSIVDADSGDVNKPAGQG